MKKIYISPVIVKLNIAKATKSGEPFKNEVSGTGNSTAKGPVS